MNRTIKGILGAILALVVTFAAIAICQQIKWKADVTDQKLYTLSNGTKAILKKLNQPITAKLFYAKTAALKGPDQIRFLNNYYDFVKALLEEYVAASNGMVRLETIDPRPFSPEEEEAIRFGLQRFSITQEENFFFGLVIKTQFGVEKVIPFFSPDRQNFIEYDISYLIDTAVTREKRKLGILSSLPVLGDETSPWMAEMKRRQGQQPTPSWTIVEQLRRQYEVKQIPADANDINDVDILLVIHPKELPEKTLFAVDQFVLKGGRTIVCVDPYCFADRPDQMMMQFSKPPLQSSDLNILLKSWGLEMPANTFAGDRSLAIIAPVRQNERPERIIGWLNLTSPMCFNRNHVVTAELNQVRVLFSGILEQFEPAAAAPKKDPNDPNSTKDVAPAIKIERMPLITTTDRGNTFTISSPYELIMLDPGRLMTKFLDGAKPVTMGYLVTGRFKSTFPKGIDIEVESPSDANDTSGKPEDPNKPKTVKKHLAGLAEAQQDCAVVVFADVDFITDAMAYQDAFFGKIVVGDNSALFLNAIESLVGSSDLISIRSRGNFRRPFSVVDKIEQQAEAESAAEIAKIEFAIASYNKQLQDLISTAKQGQEDVINDTIVRQRRDLEVKIHQANREKRQVNMKRRESIDRLGRKLQNANTLLTPAVILVAAVVLGVRRTMRKRHYISHASDA
jgi:ABC-type uncharacterized transport system involved in gliding motility auxiliary subunit